MHLDRALVICLAVTLCFPITPAFTQNSKQSYEKRQIPAVKTTMPPILDGDISDPTWISAPKAETFIDNDRNNPAPDQTTAWILYDDQYVYIAFHCKDSKPGSIVGRETVRDSKYGSGQGPGEDNVEVTLDPYMTYRWDDASQFSVNPISTPSARIGGGRAGKMEWKGDWSAAAKRVSDGWTAELRIPWKILSYRSGKGEATFGINFSRWQERTKIGSVWSNIGPQRFYELEGQWTGVHVPAGAFHPTLSLLPYILPGLERSNHTFRSGLDARYTLTQDINLVGTINPDFGTVEGAVEGIAFSRSERFVPEKRPFFMEGRDYFDAGDEYSIGNFFYPNRIPTLDIGTKVYGKITAADTIGILHAIDFHNSDDIVAKYSHTFSATSNAALFYTRKSAANDNNAVTVATADKRWGKLGVGSQWAISTGREAGGPAKQVGFYYQDKLNFTFFQMLDVSPTFRDANGLIYFNDYRGFHLYHEWHGEWRKGPWRGFGMNVYPSYDWHTDGRPFRRGFGLDMGLVNRADWDIGCGFNHSKFDDQTDFTYGMSFTANRSNRFRRWGFGLQSGSIGGRPMSFVGPTFSLRTLRRFDVSYGGSVQNLDGTQQQHIVTLNYEMSPTRSFGGRLVVQGADTNWYISYRSAGALGTEAYIILGDPNAPRFVEKLQVKFVFAL